MIESGRNIVLFILCLIGIQLSVKATEIELSWSVFHPIKKEWIELGNKGSVQELLISTGELPDPFDKVNEPKFNWIEAYKWEFKSIVFIDSSEFNKDFLELNLPNVDVYSEVYINNVRVGFTENAFRPYYFEVKNELKSGLNEIKLVFTPPVLYHKQRWESAKYHLPAPNDVNEVAIAPYTRKPQYQFGWDWSLRMNTIGLNEVATIVSYNNAKLKNYSIKTEYVKGSATITYYFDFGDVKLDSVIINSDRGGTKTLSVQDGIVEFEYQLLSPQLWWPNGFGEQFMYDDIVKFQTIGNQYISDLDLKYGVKSSELIQEQDEWGVSYYFKINGKRVFCKGGNYIPQDIFLDQVSDDDIRKMVLNMKDANFNMVRVWGGGIYQKESFYEACNEAGIMVWQDLMFACAMYPGDSNFLKNVKHELDYQIPRIAKHPSVVQFNGNNEVEVAWGNWGFQLKYGIYGDNAREVEKAYDDLFKNLAPESVNRWTNIPYIHTSPLSNWGKAEYYNFGSQHYWGVWHGKDPIEDFGKKTGRFNAEYGFQSFPEFNTLLSFSDSLDWDIKSEVMKQHQKSYVGNDMILKHAKKLFGNPENFEEFVYYSQLTQAKAVSIAIAGHRLDAPRCGGTLYWQVNDCWPVSSWSSIDYYGNWKALHYAAQEDYRNTAVLVKYDDLEHVKYYFLNDLPIEYTGVIRYSIYSLKGKKLSEDSIEVALKQFDKQEIDLSFLNKRCKKKKNTVTVFEWNDENGVSQTKLVPILNQELKRPAEYEYSINMLSETEGELILTVNSFTESLWISSSEFGVHFDTNFQSYLPGVYKLHFVCSQKGLGQLKFMTLTK